MVMQAVIPGIDLKRKFARYLIVQTAVNLISQVTTITSGPWDLRRVEGPFHTEAYKTCSPNLFLDGVDFLQIMEAEANYVYSMIPEFFGTVAPDLSHEQSCLIAKAMKIYNEFAKNEDHPMLIKDRDWTDQNFLIEI